MNNANCKSSTAKAVFPPFLEHSVSIFFLLKAMKSYTFICCDFMISKSNIYLVVTFRLAFIQILKLISDEKFTSSLFIAKFIPVIIVGFLKDYPTYTF